MPWGSRFGIASGTIDRASLNGALIGGAGYLALACLSLLVARASDSVSADGRAP